MMAKRIRKNGDIVCAAINKEEDGDIYIDDALSYILSVKKKIIVSEPEPDHTKNGGRWWWFDQVPSNVFVDTYFKSQDLADEIIRKQIVETGRVPGSIKITNEQLADLFLVDAICVISQGGDAGDWYSYKGIRLDLQ